MARAPTFLGYLLDRSTEHTPLGQVMSMTHYTYMYTGTPLTHVYAHNIEMEIWHCTNVGISRKCTANIWATLYVDAPVYPTRPILPTHRGSRDYGERLVIGMRGNKKGVF